MIGVEFGLREGQAATWGVILPPSRVADELQIESVRPMAITGLEVLGVVVNDPAAMPIATAYGFPPVGASFHELTGYAWQGSHHEVTLLIGVRLEPKASSGRIEGVRVRYLFDGGRYEVVLAWTLTITRNG